MSLRLEISSLVISIGNFSAAASISFSNSKGKSYSNKIECISVLWSPGLPRTVLIFPNGFLEFFGQSIIFACTLSPSSAPFILFSETKISAYILLLSAITKPKFLFLFFCKTPTNSVFARANISTTSASYFFPFLLLYTYAFTVSLCIPFPRLMFGIKMSSS